MRTAVLTGYGNVGQVSNRIERVFGISLGGAPAVGEPAVWIIRVFSSTL
jgi:hypothetical protein